LLLAWVFTPAFFGADFFFVNFFLGDAFLRPVRFVCFFLSFFLVPIRAVYHLSAIYGPGVASATDVSEILAILVESARKCLRSGEAPRGF
jgi:hypothetical protein